MVTETVQVKRGGTDRMGVPNKSAHGTAEVVFAWGAGSRSVGSFSRKGERGESAAITGQIYVARGEDLKARDRIVRSNGEEYVIVGHALWDQDDPFGGYDFGWMVFQVESYNG